MQDAGIVRNRLKIRAIINNANRTLEIQKEFGSFDAYLQAVGVVNDHLVSCFCYHKIPY